MFQFPGYPSTSLCVQLGMLRVRRNEFPHSEIPGSKPVHGSPRLIAVSHVLHRHLAPRHSPKALSSFSTWCGEFITLLSFWPTNISCFRYLRISISVSYYSVGKVQIHWLTSEGCHRSISRVSFTLQSIYSISDTIRPGANRRVTYTLQTRFTLIFMSACRLTNFI